MSYPSSIDTFTAVVDGVDQVVAANINGVYTAVEAIQTELGTDPAGSLTDVKTRLAVSLTAAGYLAFQAATGLTISSGAITVSRNVHTIDTEGGGASDDLDTINGGATGFVLFLRTTNSARDVVVKHGTGNITCAEGADFTLSSADQFAYGYYDSGTSTWYLARSIGAGTVTATGTTAGHVPYLSGVSEITSDDDFAYSTAAGLVGNESGGTAVDLRWESDSETHALFVDASANKTWLGGNSTGVSVDDGGATAILCSTAGALTIGNGAAGVDYTITVNGESNDLTLTYMEDENYLKTTSAVRGATSLFRRYYHIPIAAINPGGSGATWTPPDANTVGGWLLDAATEVLYLQTDVHSDWNASTDLTVEVKFEVNVDNSGGGAGDTVDLKLVCYYKGNAETACKTQTQEVATTVGASARYKRFTCTFTINYDEALNVVEAGDVIRMILNLETDTSEVDNIIINSAEYYYQTTHASIESGDV